MTLKARNKYGAKKAKRGGRTFDSKAERAYADRLELLQKAGEVAFWLEQVPLRLDGGTIYKLDFLVFECGEDGVFELRWLDVKSPATAKETTFRMKKREVEHKYGIEIECIDARGKPVS